MLIKPKNIFLFTLILFSIYSFSQIEHFLTFGTSSSFIWFQDNLKILGHSHRIFSGIIATILLTILFWCQYQFYRYYRLNPQVKIRGWIYIIATISLLAYPAAFSHDVFEYSFWARILINHRQNPWLIPGNRFADDPWANLLHWPNETYKYGPVWLFLSVIAYFWGSNDLLLTLYSMKLIMLVFSIIICFLIYKIAESIANSPKLSLAFFLFNPIVIIEFFITPHNDVVMATLLLLSIYYLIGKKSVKSWLSYIFSINIKWTTLLLAPIFTFLRKKLSFQYLLYVAHFLSLCMALILVLYRTINAWYFALFLAISSVLVKNKTVRYSCIAISVGLTLRYLPYIYMGYFDPKNKIRLYLFLISIIPFLVWYGYKIKNRLSINQFGQIKDFLKKKGYVSALKLAIETIYLI